MIKKGEIIEAIHEGVFNAHKKYEEWSGGDWIGDFGVEGFLVSEISSEIRKFQEDGEYLCLELLFKDIKEWAGASKRGRPRKEVRSERRTDIALLNKQEAPIHAIEVKRQWTKKCVEDINKLQSLVVSFSSRHEGPLKSGFLVTYYQGPRKPNNTLEKRMNDVKKYVLGSDIVDVNLGFHRALWPEDGFIERRDGKEWEYGSHIIELSRKYKS